ncbi:hypothetical protein AH01_22 [Pantoea phage AH01]|nr:hypothetical protein AH01_22 [Pantoea phage AH01]
MSEVQRLSLDMTYPFQYMENNEGNLCYYADYAALEQDRNKLSEECIKHNNMAFKYQQRAEAAEKERDRRIADYKHLVEQHMPRTSDGCGEGWSRVIEARELQVKLEAAEAKLAELEKQNPKLEYIRRLETELAQLRARPAHAADLTELVPSEWGERAYDDKDIGYESGWNDCRAGMLRNIEEAK